MAKGINEAGRGFNIVIVDPKTKEVVRVGHFDTYAEGKHREFILNCEDFACIKYR